MRNSLNAEQKFYQSVDEFATRNRTELQLGEAYVKYRFWKSAGTSTPGQILLALSCIGLYHFVQTAMVHSFLFMLGNVGGPMGACIVLGIVLLAIALTMNRVPGLGWLVLITLTIYGLVSSL